MLCTSVKVTLEDSFCVPKFVKYHEDLKTRHLKQYIWIPEPCHYQKNDCEKSYGLEQFVRNGSRKWSDHLIFQTNNKMAKDRSGKIGCLIAVAQLSSHNSKSDHLTLGHFYMILIPDWSGIWTLTLLSTTHPFFISCQLFLLRILKTQI